MSSPSRVLPPCECSPDPDPDDLLPDSSSPLSSSNFLSTEPAWPHLHLVYRLLRLLLDRVHPSLLSLHLSDRFCSQLLDLLQSGDSREREQCMRVLHAAYSRVGAERRTAIRTRMAHALLAHTFERMPHPGIAELLQLLGDIVNGFNVPLKPEHRQFLVRVLLPLHKSPVLRLFFPQLVNCVLLFLEKEPALVESALNALVRYWPRDCWPREVSLRGSG